MFQSIQIRRYGPIGDITAPFEVDAVLDDKALNLGSIAESVGRKFGDN